MSNEATYHEGYCRALMEVARLVSDLRDGHPAEIGPLLEELDQMIERARCLSRSSLASSACGDQGY